MIAISYRDRHNVRLVGIEMQRVESQVCLKCEKDEGSEVKCQNLTKPHPEMRGHWSPLSYLYNVAQLYLRLTKYCIRI